MLLISVLSVIVLAEMAFVMIKIINIRKSRSNVRLSVFNPYVLILLASSGQITLIIVLSVLTVGLAILAFYLTNKYKSQKKEDLIEVKKDEVVEKVTVKAIEEKVRPEEQKLVELVQKVAEETHEDDEEKVVFKGIEAETGLAILIRYKKSFMAKLIQADDEVKNNYSSYKNALLSYEKVTSNVSWGYDSINIGRQKLVKFNVRGKSLYVYFALNPDDFAGSKYHVDKVESKKYADTPCLYKIKNSRRAQYVYDLIGMLAKKYHLVLGEVKIENYILPFETTETLVAKGLIKEMIMKDKYENFLQKNKDEVVEEVAEQVEEVTPVSPPEDETHEEEVVFKGIEEETGLAIIIRYRKSFMAKIIQVDNEMKHYYSDLKNALLSYDQVTSSISWNYDSINKGRQKLAKFNVRGKTLYLYLALNPDEFSGSKYLIDKVESKKYADTPCLYKIKNTLRFKYAFELIEILSEKYQLLRVENKSDNYVLPYETTEALVAKGLIKEIVTKNKYEDFVKSQQDTKVVEEEKVEPEEELPKVEEKVVEDVVVVEKKKGTKNAKRVKAIINIDTISANYKKGEIVNLESLKKKGLLGPKVNYYKILSRGKIDKVLTIEANEFSLDAVKMIVTAGGKAIEITT